MPKSKTTAIAGPEIDPRSDEVVVWHVGPRSARNAPARDLTHNDIARLAYREALREIASDVDVDAGIERPDPRSPDQALCAEILAELLESGQFTTDPPAEAPQDETAVSEEAPVV